MTKTTVPAVQATVWFYLETAPRSGVFHCRGPVGPNDEPHSYMRRINGRRSARQQLQYHCLTEYLGDAVRLDGAGQKLADVTASKYQTKFGSA